MKCCIILTDKMCTAIMCEHAECNAMSSHLWKCYGGIAVWRCRKKKYRKAFGILLPFNIRLSVLLLQLSLVLCHVIKCRLENPWIMNTPPVFKQCEPLDNFLWIFEWMYRYQYTVSMWHVAYQIWRHDLPACLVFWYVVLCIAIVYLNPTAQR